MIANRDLEAERAAGALPDSKIRLARALVVDAARRGERAEPDIEEIAALPLPEDNPRRL